MALLFSECRAGFWLSHRLPLRSPAQRSSANGLSLPAARYDGGMGRERKSSAASVLTLLAIVAVVAALLGTYVGGYLWLGEVEREMYAVAGNPSLKSSIRGPGMPVVSMTRSYRSAWLVTIFKPAARLEGAIRGCQVTTALYELLEPIELGPARGPVDLGPEESSEPLDLTP